MCPFTANLWFFIWMFGWKILLVAWVLLLPIMIISRLDKIIKILEEKNKS